MAFNTLELKNMKLDSDDNFDGDDPETYVTLMTSRDRFKQCKACKKKISQELISVAWHSTTWWDCCVSDDERKEIETFLVDGNYHQDIYSNFLIFQIPSWN